MIIIYTMFRNILPLTEESKTVITEAIKTFAAQNKRRGIAILVSDLYDPAGFEEGINVLRYAKFEPYVIQVFDPIEVRPPLHGDVRLVDNETGEVREVTVTPKILERYAAAHAAYRKTIEEFCTQKQVSYFSVETTVPFDDAILGILRRGGMVG